MKQIKILTTCLALALITNASYAQKQKDVRKEVKMEIVNGEQTLTITTTEEGNTVKEVYTGDDAAKKMAEMNNFHIDSDSKGKNGQHKIRIEIDEEDTKKLEEEFEKLTENFGDIDEILEDLDINIDMDGTTMKLEVNGEKHVLDLGEEMHKMGDQIMMLISDEQEGTIDLDEEVQKLIKNLENGSSEDVFKFIDQNGEEHTMEVDENMVQRMTIITDSDDNHDSNVDQRIEVIVIARTVQIADDKSLESQLDIENFEVYPNPNDGRFNVSFDLDSKKKTQIRATDLTGKEVFSDVVKKFDGHYTNEIDLRDQPAGTYLIYVRQGNKLTTKKVLVK